MHGSNAQQVSLRTSRADWPFWAAFLASSWTWCIGMFLPVLLIRDFGIWGWIVFAVPNVVGAAAMGWVVRSAHDSLELTAAHRHACMIFSGVTIAFHMFFVISVIAPVASSVAPRQAMDLALGSVIAAGIFMYLLMTRQSGAERALATAALLVSVAAMIGIVREIWHMPQLAPPLSKDLTSGSRGLNLLCLTPVCFFGFSFCPYLDLTFHRARQHTSSPRAAFGVGFGVLFLLMIVFTLIYSGTFFVRMPRLLGTLLLVHLGMQTAFTLAAHARELRRHGARAAILAAAFTAASWIAYWLLSRGDVIADLSAGELIYRVFMGFYGLIFPAYVWLVIVPANGPTTRNLIVFVVAVSISLPLFWMGFVVGQMVWLVPGLTIVLLARLLCSDRQNQQNSAPT
jgi:hypothetical protein